MAPDVEAVTVVTADPPAADALLLCPAGSASALGSAVDFSVEGGRITRILCERDTGQTAALIAPEGPLTLRWRFAVAPSAPRWPEAAFVPRVNRWTEAAAPLVEASRDIAAAAGGGAAGIAALVAETRARFDYGHPEARFTDGHDVVPWLGCGVAQGSCIDINVYLIASLRAAGYRAAYLYGYFFPAEKGDHCEDGHCWVATEHDGEILEWDIAHHIKADLDPVRPALNPRGGRRALMTHSLGHRYETPRGALERRTLGEPVWIDAAGRDHYLPQRAIRVA